MRTWLVAREEGQCSDYRMQIVAVHDSEEGAKADAEARQAPFKRAAEEYYRVRNEIADAHGEKHIDADFWGPYDYATDDEKERSAAAWNAACNVYGHDSFCIDHTVHGPFDVVPWKVEP